MNIKIPKQIILDNTMDEKRAIVYSYFIVNKTCQNETMLSCDYIVDWCGYKINYGKNKISEKITYLINLMVNKEFFSINPAISNTKMSVATLNLDLVNDIDNMIIVDIDSINKIRHFQNYTGKINKMSSSLLLLLYLYLKMYDLDCADFIYKTCGDISKDLNVSERYISRALKILYSMGLVSTDSVTKCEYCIYKFLDIDNNVIYVGKTSSIENRLRQHFSNGHLAKECYDKTNEIFIHKFKSQMDMDIYEIYYINKYSPFYNTALKSNIEDSRLVNSINDISWTYYSKPDNYKLINNKGV